MSMVQICESCGTVISSNIEGFGNKAGYGDKGFDLCDDCMHKVEEFFVKKMKVAKPKTVKVDIPKLVGETAEAEYLERINPSPTIEVIEVE